MVVSLIQPLADLAKPILKVTLLHWRDRITHTHTHTNLYHGDVVVGHVQAHDVGEDRIRVAPVHPKSLRMKMLEKGFFAHLFS